MSGTGTIAGTVGRWLRAKRPILKGFPLRAAQIPNPGAVGSNPAGGAQISHKINPFKGGLLSDRRFL